MAFLLDHCISEILSITQMFQTMKDMFLGFLLVCICNSAEKIVKPRRNSLKLSLLHLHNVMFGIFANTSDLLNPQVRCLFIILILFLEWSIEGSVGVLVACGLVLRAVPGPRGVRVSVFRLMPLSALEKIMAIAERWPL